LSHQQQNLEMYVQQRSIMDISVLHEEIRREIESSDEVLDRQVSERRAKDAERLSQIAGVGVFFGIVIGGLQVFFATAEGQLEGAPQWIAPRVVVLGLVAVLVVLRRRSFGRRRSGR